MLDMILEQNKGVLAVIFLLLFVLYLAGLIVYRLYLSPLAKFPGPRLAAVTYLYEGYYDVVKRGKYTFKIRDLHQEYGPIIRINPFELHINDPDYYESLYNREGRWDKNPFFAESFPNDGSGFCTVEHDLHRLRRAALNPFFSKQKVTALQPLIQKLVDKLCARFEKIRGTDEVVPMECAFDAFTMDVITEYSLDTSFGYLDVPGWNSDFRELERAFGEMGYRQKMFPPFVTILRSLPDRLVVWMDPKVALFQNFLKDCGKIAERMLREKDSTKYQEKAHPTIFYEIIHSDLPPAEKTTKRLQGEAAAILGAGAVTTAWTLTTGLYHLVEQPEKLKRLRAEIRSVMPDPHQPATLQQLEKLPYLTCVIMESLRLSNGVSTRLARIAPDRNLYFHDWVIPKGTPVGMTSVLIHQNADIFPQPSEFIPERWLDPKEKQRMERYLVPFSKGTRQCLGINLAWAEMYLMLASVCTRVDLELYETTREDVEIYSDMLIAEPKRYVNGVRFRIK